MCSVSAVAIVVRRTTYLLLTTIATAESEVMVVVAMIIHGMVIYIYEGFGFGTLHYTISQTIIIYMV